MVFPGLKADHYPSDERHIPLNLLLRLSDSGSMNIESISDYKFLSNPNFSPDGEHLCFAHHEMDVENNEYISTLWIMDSKRHKKYKLTNSGKDSSYVWLNDEEILFTSGRDMGVKKEDEEEEEKDKTKFFKINIHGGEAEHLFTLDKKVSGMDISDLGVVISVWEKVHEKEEDKKELKEGKDYHELDEIPFWSNEEGFSNKKRNHLYLLDLESQDMKMLVGEYKSVQDFHVEEDKISIVLSEYEDKYQVENFLYMYDLGEDSLKMLVEDVLEIGVSRFFNGNILFAATDMERMGMNTNMDFYLYDLEKGEHRRLTDMDRSLANSLLTDIQYGGGEVFRVHDGELYFLITEDYSVNLYKFTEEHEIVPVLQEEGSIDCFDVHDEDVIYIGLRGLRPQELYDMDGRITDFNDLDFELSQPEYFQVESEGRKIDSWVMKPVGYEKGKRYPTILEIHGCPKCVYGTIHFNEMQLLVNNGYAVVFSNPSGSSGKGDEFADIRGVYGGPDYEDLMNVMDAAIERYDFIDEDRLGVAGGSYGGFMTNWVIGHTDRFAAAVSFRSIANWISKFGTTDIGYYFVEDQQGADPWSDHEQLWDRSPMKYANKVNTPTLFIQSRKDYRCWEVEAIQMFTSLKYHGIDSKLVLFEDENHGLSREGKPKQRMKRLEFTLNWFDEYLKTE